jgi:formylmethanofuran dehydrogenase subunit B
MGGAWIDGRSVALEAAAAEAARMLAASRLPVIAGLGTDIHGARAAIGLAEAVGGVVDHMHSDELLRDIDVMREAGLMATTPNEVGVRADTLLLVGAGLTVTWPDLVRRIIARKPGHEAVEGFARRIVWLGRENEEADSAQDNASVRLIRCNRADLPAFVAALRARCAGRRIGAAPASIEVLDTLAAQLQAARFGVAVWTARELDVLTIEMLCGLIDDLNAATRFAGLALPPGDNGCGVLQACGWMAGYPPRTGFGRSHPEHDPWRCDAARLVESGEADCAMWISAYRLSQPPWRRGVPLIALTGADAEFRAMPRVRIAVGRPGVDHDCVEYSAAIGTLAAVAATQRSDAVSVAGAISRIVASLPSGRAWPC